jgi:Ca2+-binding RTX toxin-like protein
VLFGNGGDDILEGGAGADRYFGGGGVDYASYLNASTGVTVSLTAPATNTGDAAGDLYNLVENLAGSQFADSLTGNLGPNVLLGLGGADTLTGGAGLDAYRYLSLTDSMLGTRDLIMDFAAGDRIDVSFIDADATVLGNQAFHFDGTAGGAMDIKVLTYDAINDRTVVNFYVDYVAGIDAQIYLKGDHDDLTAADFVL